MTSNQSMVELKQKVLSTLHMGSDNFRHAFDITKTNDPSKIDEITYKKLQSHLQMRQHILDTVNFFGDSYNDGSVDDNFAFNLISQLVAPEIRNNNVAVECLCGFLNTVFPKIASNWENDTKTKLIIIMKELQEFILSSSDYSVRVKEQVTELLISMKLRFHSEIKINEEKAREQVFTIDDLRKFNGQFLKGTKE